MLIPCSLGLGDAGDESDPTVHPGLAGKDRDTVATALWARGSDSGGAHHRRLYQSAWTAVANSTTGWLTQQILVFSKFWKLEVQGQGVSTAGFF